MENTNNQSLKYLNIARENPTYYIPLLEAQLNSFINNREMPLAKGIMYETNEGKNAWIQAIEFLQRQRPLPPLIKHPGLCRTADDHIKDLCENKIFGHKGTDGSSFSQRILRHCKKGPGAMAELIGSDFDLAGRNTPELTILSLIIDDGISDRGHRRTIFSQTYKYVGWSTGKQQEKYLTVFDLLENNLQPFEGRSTEYQTENRGFDLTKNFTYSVGSWEDAPFKDVSNNGYGVKTDQFSLPFNKRNKKMTEKRENTRTFYQNGAKIMETTTKLIYSDGTVQQNIDRRTIYGDNY